MKLIPIIILTGFLGSGKTSILNSMLRSSYLGDSAVLMNEFGEIPLDHLLVEAIDEEVLLLESGCVCCSVKDDFSIALLKLYQRRQQQQIPLFQNVILETTGIADPSVIQQLILTDADISKFYRLGSTITIVDAVYGAITLDRHIEAVKQVSVADQIFISKSDLVEHRQTYVLEHRLRGLNPLAPIRDASEAILDPGLLLTTENEDSHTVISKRLENCKIKTDTLVKSDTGLSHDHRFHTFCLCWTDAVDWQDFVDWLQALLLVRGDSIYRLKGLLIISGERKPVVIQGVQHSFYTPIQLEQWPGDKPLSELVFITGDFSRKAAIKSLENILPVSVQ